MSEIKDEIRNGRIINKEVVTAAAEELAKKRNAKLTKEMMHIAADSEFERKNALLNLQRNRDEEDPIKACLKAKEANEIAVKEGKMTPEEFREANRKADDEKAKALCSISNEYYILRNQLQKQCYDVLNDWDD